MDYKKAVITNIESLISLVSKETIKSFGGSKKSSWKKSAGLSICAFLLFGTITRPQDYTGPFFTVSATIHHIKSYVSTSLDGSVTACGLGISSKKLNFTSISGSYYFMIPAEYIQKVANKFSALFNKIKLVSSGI